jgi:hypothetical protein
VSGRGAAGKSSFPRVPPGRHVTTFQLGTWRTPADTTARYAPEAPEEFKAFLQRKQQENKQLLDFYVTEPDVSGRAALTRRGGPCFVVVVLTDVHWRDVSPAVRLPGDGSGHPDIPPRPVPANTALTQAHQAQLKAKIYEKGQQLWKSAGIAIRGVITQALKKNEGPFAAGDTPSEVDCEWRGAQQSFGAVTHLHCVNQRALRLLTRRLPLALPLGNPR